MDPRQQLTDLAVATGRSLTKAITFDARSQTYGCQISEPRLTTAGVQPYVIAEVRGQPDRTTAEREACRQAVYSLNVTSVNVAISQYR